MSGKILESVEVRSHFLAFRMELKYLFLPSLNTGEVLSLTAA